MSKLTKYILDLIVLFFALYYSLNLFASDFDITEILSIASVMMIYTGWHLYTTDICFKDLVKKD